MTETTIDKSIILAKPPATVWNYLTNKEKLGQWFHPAQANLAVDEDFALVRPGDDGEMVKQCWGKVQEMNEPTHMIYSFTVKPLNGAMTTVTWSLQEIPGGTKLSMHHEGIGQAAGDAAMGLLMALDNGWECHLIDLRKALA